MKHILGIVFFSFLLSSLYAQSQVIKLKSYMIKSDLNESDMRNAFAVKGHFQVKDHIPFTNIYLIEDLTKAQNDKSSDLYKDYPFIKYASLNRPLELRAKEPNDVKYGEQWQYGLLHAPEAWEFGTGGVTCLGDTIVMAVFDAGFESKHEDLNSNIWRNRKELYNGIDDDQNGYVDDVLGLNTYNDSDKHDIQSHGTRVAGVMGARGNNNIGVSGTSWSNKIMLISFDNFDNSDYHVVKGMHYILTQRRRYDASNGSEGAFIVSLNCSFGRADEFPEDGHELWCAMYDSLGLAGIVSAGATSNSDTNVDVEGDIPSTCQSEYLIVVNNFNQSDKKVNSTGYGKKNVDIGAFGDGVFTVNLNNSYGGFSGTSAATPHVASTIALLYSTECCKLTNMAHTNPSEAANLVKSFILNGGIDASTNKGITTTGKRLDMMGSMNQLLAYCGNITGGGDIKEIVYHVNNQEIEFKATLPHYGTYAFMIYDVLGIERGSGSFEYTEFGAQYFTANTSQLIPGSYILTIWDGNNPVSRKFVKFK